MSTEESFQPWSRIDVLTHLGNNLNAKPYEEIAATIEAWHQRRKDVEAERDRFLLQRDQALDVLENIVSGYELPGDHCEFTDALVQARNLLATYPCGGKHDG